MCVRACWSSLTCLGCERCASAPAQPRPQLLLQAPGPQLCDEQGRPYFAFVWAGSARGPGEHPPARPRRGSCVGTAAAAAHHAAAQQRRLAHPQRRPNPNLHALHALPAAATPGPHPRPSGEHGPRAVATPRVHGAAREPHAAPGRYARPSKGGNAHAAPPRHA